MARANRQIKAASTPKPGARKTTIVSTPAASTKTAATSEEFRKGDLVETPWQRNRFVVMEANGYDLTVHRLADPLKEPLRIDARDVARIG